MQLTTERLSYELFREMKLLLEEHYQEIAHFKDIKLRPDYEKYLLLDSAGVIKTYVARDHVSQKMIGYAIFFVQPNLHYSESLQAVQDILFITKEQRGYGRYFIQYCDDMLTKEGVQVVYHHVKAAHNFGPLLERMNYKLVDLIFSKRLDGVN